MIRSLSMLSLLALAACGGVSAKPAGEVAFTVRGADVVLQTTAPFAASPDLPARVESTVEVALKYWGGSWEDVAGITLTLTDAPKVACGGGEALGCTQGGEMTIVTADPGVGTFACVEQTVLVHEVGHAVLGDARHTDPRWMSFDLVAELLAGRVGYAAGGTVDCTIYPSVWRHPLEEP